MNTLLPYMMPTTYASMSIDELSKCKMDIASKVAAIKTNIKNIQHLHDQELRFLTYLEAEIKWAKTNLQGEEQKNRIQRYSFDEQNTRRFVGELEKNIHYKQSSLEQLQSELELIKRALAIDMV